MGEHLVLYVNRLARPGIVQSVSESSSADPSGPPPSAVSVDGPTTTAITITDPSLDAVRPSCPTNDEGRLDHHDSSDEEGEPFIQMAECRICQEEDCFKNLESPCACSGSLKYAHRKCVQHWCNEKGDIICEICHQSYQPDYTTPPPPLQSEETAIDIGGWAISGAPLELDPRVLAIAETDSHFMDTEYDEYSSSNSSGVAFFRSVALILMALLLLRHALSVPDADADDDDSSSFFALFLLRAAGFLLPCYIMAWAFSILQQRRQRQEAAALAATQVAFVLQSGQHRGLQFTIASSSSGASRQSGATSNTQPETV